ncbi:13321_t:CDS:2, partial [Racocetra persica]
NIGEEHCENCGQRSYTEPKNISKETMKNLNNKVIDVHYVEVGRKNHESLKCREKDKMIQKVDDINIENNEVVKRVKINREFAKAMIRTKASSHIDDEFVGYILRLEVDIDSIK